MASEWLLTGGVEKYALPSTVTPQALVKKRRVAGSVVSCVGDEFIALHLQLHFPNSVGKGKGRLVEFVDSIWPSHETSRFPTALQAHGADQKSERIVYFANAHELPIHGQRLPQALLYWRAELCPESETKQKSEITSADPKK